jgi:peptidoglycan/LPS O-acetylase OafA/YrhL
MKFRADIQGLRALAVLLVIAHHAFPEVVSGGFFGVDIFFVISGYIITQILLRDQNKPLSKLLIDFYARRIRRILPSALLVIAGSTIATYLLLGSITGADTARDAFYATLFVANIHFNSLAIDYFTSGLPQPILQHYWSLAIEEQFYLIWPLLFALSIRFRKAALLVVSLISVISFIWAISEIASGSGLAYFSTLTRVWELGAGAVLALTKKQFSSNLMGYFSLAAILFLSVIFTPATEFPGFPALLVVFLTVLLLLFGCENRVLKSRPLIYLGDISFLLYLVHWPVLQIHKIYFGRDANVLETGLLITFIFVLSSLLHKCFENPIRYSTTLTRKPVMSILCGAIMIVGFAIVFNTLRGNI